MSIIKIAIGIVLGLILWHALPLLFIIAVGLLGGLQ
jgi:hypothetical protein